MKKDGAALTARELRDRLERSFGVPPEEADPAQYYFALSDILREELTRRKKAFDLRVRRERAKTVYYLSMEFLPGKNLQDAATCLGERERIEAVLREAGCRFCFDDICTVESDPGLGNGGLGRLAACYLSSLAALSYPAVGYSICYEKGFFEQKIVDGEQIENPDGWLSSGSAWLVPDESSRRKVLMGGTVKEEWGSDRCRISVDGADELDAVPYDLFVPGAGSEAVNALRLWKAVKNEKNGSTDEWDRDAVSQTLYPKDDLLEGKMLRLSQQYFLVSASIGDIVDKQIRLYGTLDGFADRVAIHINDTHPALAIPELMRVLMDEHGKSWDEAWGSVRSVVSYTNHTVLPEALETWNSDLFRMRLPRIASIVGEINERQSKELWERYPGDFDRISKMAITAYSRVRMAPLCVAASHCVNGVSKIHSRIVKNKLFRDRYEYDPSKFRNVTNGVSHIRWLIESNPALSALIRDAIGDSFIKDPSSLKELAKYGDDGAFLSALSDVKRQNKRRLCEFTRKETGALIDPDSVFDVHIKRIHEYKRQLMNVLKILLLYRRIKEGDGGDIPQTTFIFGGKAAPGYRFAKTVIRLIWKTGEMISADREAREILRVVFAENYGVTSAGIIVPSAQISEQISLAGKEASGTGCMKMMMNGAVLLGTEDGANAEIRDAVGEGNAYIFGLTADETERAAPDYRPQKYYIENDRVRAAVDTLDIFPQSDGFDEIKRYLLYGGDRPDPYMCLLDFEPYMCAWEKAARDARDDAEFARKSLANISNSGYFSSDRAVGEYAREIWGLRRIL